MADLESKQAAQDTSRT
jgi:hypothetical protein